MSKWTMKQILETIKPKDLFSVGEHHKQIIISVHVSGFKFIDTNVVSDCNINGFSGLSEWSGFKFFNPDGTEILPPEDKVKKLYAYREDQGSTIMFDVSEYPTINHKDLTEITNPTFVRAEEYDIEYPNE